MGKYKAKVCSVEAKQFEKKEGSQSKIPEGTWYVHVLFKCSDKWVQDREDWEEISLDKDMLMHKNYFLSQDITHTNAKGETKTQFETSKYFMERELGFAGASDELETLLELEVELVTLVNGEYENIQYINRPGSRKPLVEPSKKQDFASIFDKDEVPF